MDVQAVYLHLGRARRPMVFVDDLEYNEHYGYDVYKHRNNAQRLNAKLSKAAAV